MKKIIYVRITGATYATSLKVVGHRVEAFPSNTYHVFDMENGSTLWLNDFGIQSLVFAADPKDLN